MGEGLGPEVGGILAPRPGIEHAPSALEGDFLTTRLPGKIPKILCGAGAGDPTKRRPLGEGQGTEPPAPAAAEGQDQAGSLGERCAEIPPGPGHVPLSCGHYDHKGPAPQDTEVGSPTRVRGRPAQRGQGPPHRTAGPSHRPWRQPRPLVPSALRRERPGAREDPRLEPHLHPLPWAPRPALVKPPARRRVGGHCPPSFPSLPVEGL